MPPASGSGAIEDATKIWWDLRPSDRFPTLESRICDLSPRLEHALSIAALTQCLMRLLFRLRARNQRWRIYDNFLVSENRWRAQRHGMDKGLIDFGRSEVVEFSDLVDEMIELVAQDAEALACTAEVQAMRNILTAGNSATRQRRVYSDSREGGHDHDDAMKAVTQSLIDEYSADL